MKCEPAQFRLLHAMLDEISRAYPPLTARDVKQYLLTELPRYLAQAEGREIPPRTKRASTLAMSVSEMAECIEWVMWFSVGAGVQIHNGV